MSTQETGREASPEEDAHPGPTFDVDDAKSIGRSIVTGSGRCGTLSLAGYLDGMAFRDGRRVRARHESSFRKIAVALVREDNEFLLESLSEFDHDIEVNPLVSLFSSEVIQATGTPILGLVRDGRHSVRSGFNKSWYINPKRDPLHWSNALPSFDGDRFTRCCKYWSWVYRRLDSFGVPIFRLEDLSENTSPLLERLLVEPDGSRSFPCLHSGTLPNYESIKNSMPQLPPWDDWPDHLRRTFEEYCGDVMDRYYPGWRTSG